MTDPAPTPPRRSAPPKPPKASCPWCKAQPMHRHRLVQHMVLSHVGVTRDRAEDEAAKAFGIAPPPVQPPPPPAPPPDDRPEPQRPAPPKPARPRTWLERFIGGDE